MKMHTNIVIKYWFEIFAICDWPPTSLLHCVLLEICHVTMVSHLTCIQTAESLDSSSVEIWGIPGLHLNESRALPHWLSAKRPINGLGYPNVIYDSVAMMLLTICALSLLSKNRMRINPCHL